MRPIIALLLSIFFLGGTYAYTRFAAGVRYSATGHEIVFTDKEYFVEIRKTFDSPPHPIFGESLIVKLTGEVVFGSDESVSAEEIILVGPLENVESGKNELLVTAARDGSQQELAAMQVKVIKDGIPVANRLIVAEPGLDLVRGEVVFSVEDEPDDH